MDNHYTLCKIVKNKITLFPVQKLKIYLPLKSQIFEEAIKEK